MAEKFFGLTKADTVLVGRTYIADIFINTPESLNVVVVYEIKTMPGYGDGDSVQVWGYWHSTVQDALDDPEDGEKMYIVWNDHNLYEVEKPKRKPKGFGAFIQKMEGVSNG